MKNEKVPDVLALIDVMRQIDTQTFDKFIANYLDQRDDKNQALMELDMIVAALQNHSLLWSIFIKQKYLIKHPVRSVALDELYTKKQIADRYKVNLKTVSNWIRNGLVAEKIDGVVRISLASIEAYKLQRHSKKLHRVPTPT